MNRRDPQLESEKAKRKAHMEAGLFIQFSVKPFRAWRLTIKATKAEETSVHDSDGLNWR